VETKKESDIQMTRRLPSAVDKAYASTLLVSMSHLIVIAVFIHFTVAVLAFFILLIALFIPIKQNSQQINIDPEIQEVISVIARLLVASVVNICLALIALLVIVLSNDCTSCHSAYHCIIF